MSTLTFPLLRELGDGEFHSGEAMARHFGVSRSAVWHALKSLQDAGVEVFRVPGRGYRLREPIEWLDAARVAAAMNEAAPHFTLEIADEVDSTNRRMLTQAAQGIAQRSVLVAERQSAGRGRRGREWLGRIGGSLTFSVLWRFEQGASGLSGLSLAVGVALIRALRELGVGDAALKWPNDVQHAGRKLAGILIEMQGDVAGPCAVVVGIGINVRLGDALLGQIDQAATDLSSLMRTTPSRNVLLGTVLRHLFAVMETFASAGFAGVREEWQIAHAYHDREVQLLLPDGTSRLGVVLGVDADGALLLRSPQGESRWLSGEVSLRSAP